jgi:hypothetical protein
MSCRHITLVAVASWLVASLPALAELAPEDLARNRRAFEQLRNHPEHLQRLRTDAKAFFALPEERRDQIMQLDRDLTAMPAATQTHLHSVMDRYAAWLAKLDAGDRKKIDAAQGSRTRLVVVREIRDQEWMRYQPKARRERYAALEGAAKAQFVNKLRQDEHERQLEWRLARRFWRELDKGFPLPAKLADFPADVTTYVNEYLRPLLAPEEIDRLESAQGKWPLFPITMVEIADKHPAALPGPKGPTLLAELPTEVKARLKNKKGDYYPLLVKMLRPEKQKHWPEFAITVTSFLANRKSITLPHELWPWGYTCLSPVMKEFVDKKLIKVLDSDEKLRLISAEGKWPDYPVAIQETARHHNLPVPWQTLPGTRERWANYRDLD